MAAAPSATRRAHLLRSLPWGAKGFPSDVLTRECRPCSWRGQRGSVPGCSGGLGSSRCGQLPNPVRGLATSQGRSPAAWTLHRRIGDPQHRLGSTGRSQTGVRQRRAAGCESEGGAGGPAGTLPGAGPPHRFAEWGLRSRIRRFCPRFWATTRRRPLPRGRTGQTVLARRHGPPKRPTRPSPGHARRPGTGAGRRMDRTAGRRGRPPQHRRPGRARTLPAHT